jgi:hypothetical protein
MKMYMEAPDREPEGFGFGPAILLALSFTAVAVLYIGICPTTYLNLALESVKPLF